MEVPQGCFIFGFNMCWSDYLRLVAPVYMAKENVVTSERSSVKGFDKLLDDLNDLSRQSTWVLGTAA